MATIAAVIDRTISANDQSVKVTWSALTNATSDVGAAVSFPEFGTRTFQLTGTFGVGGTLVLEGSNDGATWAGLGDLAGTAISLTAAGLKTAGDVPLYVRPRVSAGDGTTSLTVQLVAHRA